MSESIGTYHRVLLSRSSIFQELKKKKLGAGRRTALEICLLLKLPLLITLEPHVGHTKFLDFHTLS